MRRDLDRLTATTFDLLVIGGGIHGLAAAYDAAQRGLSVALVEREDFGSGASFNHLRTVHGGLRSLQTGDLRKFRLSIRERRTFARIAPHLVEPLGFLLPTSRSLTRSRLAFAAAFLLDALLGFDRNHDLPPSLHLPRGRTLSRASCLAIDPTLEDQDITGGALWYDYQMPRAERLTLAFAHAASEAGAREGGPDGVALANYVEAEQVLLDGGRVTGARVRDRVTSTTFDVAARTVLNAAGAGIPSLLAGSRVTQTLPLQKAINLVTTRPMGAIAIGGSHAGGTLIRVPWRGRAIVGTWHASSPAAAASAEVTEAELDAVIADVNATFPKFALDREEVTLVHRGLVPAHVDRHGIVHLQSESRILDHAGDGVAGLISIRGAKYTTARAVAEDAVNLIERQLGREHTPCRTANTPLPGSPTEAEAEQLDMLTDELCRAHPGVGAGCARHLVLAYGTRWRDVLALARDIPSFAEPIDPAHPAIRAEIAYAVRHEMALTLTDVVARRIQIGAAGNPGDRTAHCCAAIMRDECGWSESRTDDELRALRELYRPL
jgi:glycerol-3-phosphate dehydrogenase